MLAHMSSKDAISFAKAWHVWEAIYYSHCMVPFDDLGPTNGRHIMTHTALLLNQVSKTVSAGDREFCKYCYRWYQGVCQSWRANRDSTCSGHPNCIRADKGSFKPGSLVQGMRKNPRREPIKFQGGDKLVWSGNDQFTPKGCEREVYVIEFSGLSSGLSYRLARPDE